MPLFHARLNYLMSAIGFKNSELSEALFVDPSLVSRWRTGKRVPSQDTIRQISQVIVQLCVNYKDRLLLCKAINLNYRDEYFDTSQQLFEHTLFLWLTQDSEADPTDINLKWNDEGVRLGMLPERAEIFEGDNGTRYCLSTLMSMAIRRGEPFTMVFYSNASIEWLVNNDSFFSEFKRFLDKARMLSVKIQLVYHATNKPKLAMCYAKLWSIIEHYDNSELYGVAVRETPMRQFTQLLVAIPDVGAISGWSQTNSSNKYVLLLTDKRSTRHIAEDCHQLLSGCEPLMRRHTGFDYEELMGFTTEQTNIYYDSLYHSTSLPLGTMPQSVLRTMLENANTTTEEIERYIMVHKRYTEWFRTYLKKGRVEYYYYPRDDGKGDHILPQSTLLFGRVLLYTPKLYKQHLASVMDLMRNELDRENSNFNFFHVPRPIYPTDVQIGYNAFLISYQNEYSDKVALCTHQHYANNVLDYISQKARELPQDVFPQARNIASLQMLYDNITAK